MFHGFIEQVFTRKKNLYSDLIMLANRKRYSMKIKLEKVSENPPTIVFLNFFKSAHKHYQKI